MHSSRKLLDMIEAEEYGLFDDPLGRALRRLQVLGLADAELDRLTMDRVHRFQTQRATGHLAPFPQPPPTQGEIPLGPSSYGADIHLSRKALACHVLCASMTGGGKTTLTAPVALNVAASGGTVWLTELYKDEMRALGPAFRTMGTELATVTTETVCFNLLEAGDGDPLRHLNRACDGMARALGASETATRFLRRGVHELYERFGIWEGRRNAWPTLGDLVEWLRETPGLNPQARESLLSRLVPLLQELSPACWAYRRGWTAKAMRQVSILFSLGSASEPAKALTLPPILFGLFDHEVQRGRPNQGLRLVVFIEDGQRLLMGNEGWALTPIEELLGVIRGAGIGVWMNVQSMHGLSKALLANAATKIMGRLGTFSDYQALGHDMGMNREQIEWMMRNPRPGRFVAQTAEGNFHRPALLQARPFDLGRRSEPSLGPLASLPTVAADEFRRWTPVPQVRVTSPQFSDAEVRFVRAVVESPGRPSSHYAKLAGMSGKRAIQVRTRLVELGVLREHLVATSTRGRRAIVLEPLEKAEGVLEGSWS